MYRLFPNSETSHLSIGSFCGEIRIKQNYDEPAQVSPIGNNIKLSTEKSNTCIGNLYKNTISYKK